MNDRSARAYLTHIAEPGDPTIGMHIQEFGPSQTLALAYGHDRYRPRMVLDMDEGRVDEWLDRMLKPDDLTFLTPDDVNWPYRIDDLPTNEPAPAGLWVRGDATVLGRLRDEPSVSIVGARAATSYGEHVATEITHDLVRRGLTVVSGGAYGIDGAAHRATLAAGGKTVAFMAGGVDRFYPAGHNELLTRVTVNGAVVSEVPPGSTPTKWRFLMRNRLIATATMGTVVVEAGFRSGSLNTAGHAHSAGRPLGAVPGPITSAASMGCHRLIREMGATCITSADDVLMMLGIPS